MAVDPLDFSELGCGLSVLGWEGIESSVSRGVRFKKPAAFTAVDGKGRAASLTLHLKWASARQRRGSERIVD